MRGCRTERRRDAVAGRIRRKSYVNGEMSLKVESEEVEVLMDQSLAGWSDDDQIGSGA